MGAWCRRWVTYHLPSCHSGTPSQYLTQSQTGNFIRVTFLLVGVILYVKSLKVCKRMQKKKQKKYAEMEVIKQKKPVGAFYKSKNRRKFLWKNPQACFRGDMYSLSVSHSSSGECRNGTIEDQEDFLTQWLEVLHHLILNTGQQEKAETFKNSRQDMLWQRTGCHS